MHFVDSRVSELITTNKICSRSIADQNFIYDIMIKDLNLRYDILMRAIDCLTDLSLLRSICKTLEIPREDELKNARFICWKKFVVQIELDDCILIYEEIFPS